MLHVKWSRLLVASLVLAGCSNDFEPPSQVDTLRVLAVVPEPASGSPGQTSTLDLVIADGAPLDEPDAGSSRPLQLIWLGGCHNPPGRQFYGCYPLLHAAAARLSSRVVDTPPSNLPPGVFGTRSRFELAVPADILSAAPKAASDPVHYGVSFAFFAVCAGELRSRPDVTDRLPLDCVNPSSGEALGRSDFVSGYATLYSYEGVTNHDPVLQSIHFGSGTLTPTTCAQDADCAGLVDPASAGFDEVCGNDGLCSPLVPACPSAGSCPTVLVSPEVPASSAEALPNESAREILWASFYATSGSFETATQLINDRSSGFISDHGAFFRPPPSAASPSAVWITVNDERGGAAFQSFEVWTR